ncbi:hypothetical protein GUJ93_ZPchr0008g14117 [Zizania palustris]|uniref:Uncharacterized protein n=1 Tax=Zizania palustris TaxID=103762 RepID=A0A8J5RW13_ZIZPA|nr:hypothetical protein GUJ93_ZPchr0008g14117 [Zizania palustris]
MLGAHHCVDAAADAAAVLRVLRLTVAAGGDGFVPGPRPGDGVPVLVRERFGVLVRVHFGCRVSALEYAGAYEGELMAWEHWAGNGQAFGTGRLVGLEDHRPEAALQRVLARGQPAGSGADGHPLLLHSKSEGSTVCN